MTKYKKDNNVHRYRKCNEEQCNEFYRRIIDDLTEMVCRFNKDCRITFVNDAYCKYFGVDKDELIGKSFLAFVPEEEHETIKLQIAALSPQNPINEYTHQVIKPNGEKGWQSWIDKGVFNAKGELIEVQSVGRDITEIVKLHGLVNLGKNFIEKLIVNCPLPLFVITPNHKITYWNNACARITGIGRKKAEGTEIHREYFPIDGDNTLADLVVNGSLLNGINRQKQRNIRIVPEGYVYEKWVTTINDEKKCFNIYVTPIYNEENELISVIQMIDDITKIVKVETRLEREILKAKEVLERVLPDEFSDERLSIKYIFEPSYHIGGDLIDFTWDNTGNKLYGAVIDVAGHGFYTALQSLTVRLMFRETIKKDIPLSEKAFIINNKIVDNFIDESFAAAIFFELDFDKMEINYVSAGINDFFILTENTKGRIKSPGMFLGILKNEEFREQRMKIKPGDSFFFISDGLLEILPKNFKEHMDDFDTTLELLKLFINISKRFDDMSALCLNIK